MSETKGTGLNSVTTGTANFEHRPAPIINQPSTLIAQVVTPDRPEPYETEEPSDLDRVATLAQALLDAGMDIDALLWRMMRLDV